MDSSKIAFCKGTSSLFVIATPLHILCMVEAIREFEIEDFEIIVLVHPKEQRCFQVKQMLNDLRFKYHCIDYSIENTFMLSFGWFKQKINLNKYQRVYIGDYYYLLYYLIGLQYILSGGVFVCLDDGNLTVGALIGQKRFRSLKTKIYILIRNFRLYIKNINYEQYFYTIYSTIPTKKKVYANNLSHLITQFIIDDKVSDQIYFIGTNPADYINDYGITEATYLNWLTVALYKIRKENLGKSLFYVPHGRDQHVATENICKELGFNYLKIDCAVEYYFLKYNIHPFLVAGFQSSALYNIKMIFPSISVVNFYINNPNALLYKELEATFSLYRNSNISCYIRNIDELL